MHTAAARFPALRSEGAWRIPVYGIGAVAAYWTIERVVGFRSWEDRVKSRGIAAMLGLAGPWAGPALAQPTGEELAKQLSNPVSSLISVPFQNNTDFGLGPGDDGVQNLLNIQPVIPISLTPEWNLISRTILPLVYQDHDVIPGTGDEFGTGDVLQSFFLSPVEEIPGGVIFGAGPVFRLDTASDDRFGSDQWGAGPTFVALKQTGGWTYGILANHVWGFAGDEDRQHVSSTFLQPFLAHNWKSGFGLTLQTETTYDWRGNQWTVPINLVASQVLKLGPQRVQLSLGGRYYAEAPEFGPDWGVRAVVTLLFPK